MLKTSPPSIAFVAPSPSPRLISSLPRDFFTTTTYLRASPTSKPHAFSTLP